MCTVDRTRLLARKHARRTAAGRATAIASVPTAVAFAAALATGTSGAQPRGGAAQPTADEEASPLEALTERVTALERLVASLDTRFSALQAAPRPPEPGLSAAQRIDDLERQVAQLRLDLQRLQTSVDSAQRTAEGAQRSATQAENTAREALFRSR